LLYPKIFKVMSLLIIDKNTEISRITDDFCKEFSKENGKTVHS
jgi:hypothetical protein